jgi:hypothetical protein
MQVTPRLTILFAVALLLACSVASAQKLGGAVGYNLSQIEPRLDKAEKLLAQGDAKNALSYYETAKTQWDSVHRDFKGKFDTNHPQVVAMRKRLDGIAAKLAAAGVLSAPSGDRLDARIVRELQEIDKGLDRSVRLLEQGDQPNAVAAFSSAQQRWDAIHKDFAGKFKKDHPDIVAMGKKMSGVGAKLTAAGLAVSKTKTPTADAGSGGDAKAPPAAMVYVMKQIHASLDAAERAAKEKRPEEARTSFGQADQQWKAQQEWNKGKYDPNHPAIVALAEKYERVRAAVAGLDRESAEAAKNLPAVLDAIENSQQQLAAAYQEARAGFRNVASMMGDFDTGREQDVDKLRVKVDELRLKAERVNALLPGALIAARAFRKQYPDFGQLEKLVKDGRKAGQAVERLEQFPAQWLSDAERLINEALSYADENIKQFGITKLADLQGSDVDRRELAAGSAEQWVLSYSEYLLDTIPSVLPELPKEAEAALPEFGAARQAFEKRADVMRGQIAEVAAAVTKTRKDVADARRRRLEGARFPKTGHAPGGSEKDIRAAWAGAIKDKQLVKLSVYRPYEVRSEARWHRDHWVVNTYRYIGVNCLAKLSSGKYMVYRMTFRNTRQPDGSWGPLEHWGVGHVYEILAENIDK